LDEDWNLHIWKLLEKKTIYWITFIKIAIISFNSYPMHIQQLRGVSKFNAYVCFKLIRMVAVVNRYITFIPVSSTNFCWCVKHTTCFRLTDYLPSWRKPSDKTSWLIRRCRCTHNTAAAVHTTQQHKNNIFIIDTLHDNTHKPASFPDIKIGSLPNCTRCWMHQWEAQHHFPSLKPQGQFPSMTWTTEDIFERFWAGSTSPIFVQAHGV